MLAGWRPAVLACALLGACASASSPEVDPDLRGCWIERRGEDALTMRWFPDPAGGWRGAMLNYHRGDEPDGQLFLLTPDGASGWTICPREDDGLPHGPPCRPAFFGPGRAIAESDWMELHAEPETLRFLYRPDADSEIVLFDGARDGCD